MIEPPPVTFVCVLRTGGGTFDRSWVLALFNGISAFAPPGFRFACLTDDTGDTLSRYDDRIRVIPFTHMWPGWWSKVELFRPGLFEGRVIYIDLDTLPVGDLSDLAGYAGAFAMLSDFYQPRIAASGVMTWEGDECAELYERFRKEPPVMVGRLDYWINRTAPEISRLQTHYPNQLVSFKAHARTGIPRGARLVCFHGRPRPNEPSAGWGFRTWIGRVPEGMI